jgi:hypothetical protein
VPALSCSKVAQCLAQRNCCSSVGWLSRQPRCLRAGGPRPAGWQCPNMSSRSGSGSRWGSIHARGGRMRPMALSESVPPRRRMQPCWIGSRASLRRLAPLCQPESQGVQLPQERLYALPAHQLLSRGSFLPAMPCYPPRRKCAPERLKKPCSTAVIITTILACIEWPGAFGDAQMTPALLSEPLWCITHPRDIFEPGKNGWRCKSGN